MATEGEQTASEKDKPVDAYRVVYEEATRALALQSQQLDELRSRTNLLLSSAVVATAFLAPASLELRPPLSWAGWLATGLFVTLSATLMLGVLRPRTAAWEFSSEPGELLYGLENDPAVSTPGLYAKVAESASVWLRDNDKHLSSMYRGYSICGVLLLVEIAAWLLDILLRR